MKKIRYLLLYAGLLFFAAGLENCNKKDESYCRKELQKSNCQTKNFYEEESPSNVFPEKDLIIKI